MQLRDNIASVVQRSSSTVCIRFIDPPHDLHLKKACAVQMRAFLKQIPSACYKTGAKRASTSAPAGDDDDGIAPKRRRYRLVAKNVPPTPPKGQMSQQQRRELLAGKLLTEDELNESVGETPAKLTGSLTASGAVDVAVNTAERARLVKLLAAKRRTRRKPADTAKTAVPAPIDNSPTASTSR